MAVLGIFGSEKRIVFSYSSSFFVPKTASCSDSFSVDFFLFHNDHCDENPFGLTRVTMTILPVQRRRRPLRRVGDVSLGFRTCDKRTRSLRANGTRESIGKGKEKGKRQSTGACRGTCRNGRTRWATRWKLGSEFSIIGDVLAAFISVRRWAIPVTSGSTSLKGWKAADLSEADGALTRSSSTTQLKRGHKKQQQKDTKFMKREAKEAAMDARGFVDES